MLARPCIRSLQNAESGRGSWLTHPAAVVEAFLHGPEERGMSVEPAALVLRIKRRYRTTLSDFVCTPRYQNVLLIPRSYKRPQKIYQHAQTQNHAASGRLTVLNTSFSIRFASHPGPYGTCSATVS